MGHLNALSQTAFNFFAAEVWPKAKEQLGHAPGQDVAKLVGELWAQTDEADRVPYMQMAAQDKERFEREKLDYEGEQQLAHAGPSQQPGAHVASGVNDHQAGGGDEDEVTDVGGNGVKVPGNGVVNGDGGQMDGGCLQQSRLHDLGTQEQEPGKQKADVHSMEGCTVVSEDLDEDDDQDDEEADVEYPNEDEPEAVAEYEAPSHKQDQQGSLEQESLLAQHADQYC